MVVSGQRGPAVTEEATMNAWAAQSVPQFQVNGWTVIAPSPWSSGFWQALKGSEQFAQAWTKNGLLKKIGVK